VAIGASAIGTVMVYAYLTVLSPTEGCEDCRPGLGVEIAMVSAYFVVAAFVTWHLAGGATRGLLWLDEGRAPTDKERRATLRLPSRVGATVFVAWVVAGGLATTAAALAGSDFRSVLRTVTTIVLVGLVIATLVAFTLERTGRSVFARALAGDDVVLPSRWLGLRTRLLLGWGVSSAVPLLGLLLLPFTTANEDREDVAITVFSLSLLGLVGGFAITAVAARGITSPLRDVRRALKAVGEGDLDTTVSVDASGELGQVQQGVNGMVAGLRERHRLETLLGHHVGTEVAQLALTGELASEQRQASALFVDVVGSTAMAEELSPPEVVRRLNDLFAVVVRVVEQQGGLVNKFDGDGALCVFGAPTAQPDHATRALCTARTLRAELDDLGETHPGLDAGIGVSSGLVVAGRVGAAERYEYTVLGRPVNEAARLTEAAKARPARVLASADALERAAPDELLCWVEAGALELRGLAQPTSVFEPR
jgi:adenylate cyclase